MNANLLNEWQVRPSIAFHTEFLHECPQQNSWFATFASNVAPNTTELCCTDVPDIDHNNNSNSNHIGVESGICTFDLTIGTMPTAATTATAMHSSVSLLLG